VGEVLEWVDDRLLALLAATLVLQMGHVAIHLANTFRWKRPTLPPYDAWVGYLGALAWFVTVVASRGLEWDPPPATSLVGIAMTASGLYVHGAGIRDLLRYRDDGPLVTKGIYSKLRHPIYYGWILVCFGMPMLFRSWLGLLTAPLWAGIMVLVAILEQRDLARALPEGVYEDYSKGTIL
jgi:protein-S-isoprenylcysteine O-methyltransferase Ste14